MLLSSRILLDKMALLKVPILVQSFTILSLSLVAGSEHRRLLDHARPPHRSVWFFYLFYCLYLVKWEGGAGGERTGDYRRYYVAILTGIYLYHVTRETLNVASFIGGDPGFYE